PDRDLRPGAGRVPAGQRLLPDHGAGSRRTDAPPRRHPSGARQARALSAARGPARPAGPAKPPSNPRRSLPGHTRPVSAGTRRPVRRRGRRRRRRVVAGAVTSPSFSYLAASREGKLHRGIMRAETPADVTAALGALGLSAVEIEAAPANFRGRTAPRRELSIL